MKDWWKKRKAKKAAKKQAKVDAKVENAAAKQLGDTGVMTQPLLSGAPQALGNDSANRVYKTQNKANRPFANGETTGYYKPNQDMAPAKNAVAASRMANGLGMGDLIPETKFAQLDTGKGLETGALSAAAKGEALHSNVFDTDITDEVKAQRRKDGRSEDLSDYQSSDTKKLKGDRVMQLTGSEVNDIDLSRPNTQSGLNRLQWFDALIGNMDRHGANIIVDPTTGDVSGIDNDLSFDRGARADWGDAFTDGDNHFLGLPDMIDEDTASKLLALDDAKIKQLLQTDNKAGDLKNTKMTDKAVTQTIDRLKVIQAKVRSIQADTGGNYVKKWDKSTYDKQVNAPKRKNFKGVLEPNYIARHATFVKDAKDNTQSALWRKGHRDIDRPVVDAPRKDEDKDSEWASDESVASESEEDKDGIATGLPTNSAESGSGDEASEEEKEEVAAVIGQEMSVPDALLYIDDLIAELEQLEVEMDGQTGDEKDAGPMAQTGGRPPVPNVASSGESETEEKDEEQERKARFRAARSKFANV